MTDTAPLTDQQLDAIRQRHEAASSGHWYLNRGTYDDPNFVVAEYHGYAHGVGSFDFGDGDEADADREFVLNAHTDMGVLLAEVGRLRAELAAADKHIIPRHWHAFAEHASPEAIAVHLDSARIQLRRHEQYIAKLEALQAARAAVNGGTAAGPTSSQRPKPQCTCGEGRATLHWSNCELYTSQSPAADSTT